MAFVKHIFLWLLQKCAFKFTFRVRVFVYKILSPCFTQGAFVNRTLIVFILRFSLCLLMSDQIINANSRHKLNWIFANVCHESQVKLYLVWKDLISSSQFLFYVIRERKQQNKSKKHTIIDSNGKWREEKQWKM